MPKTATTRMDTTRSCPPTARPAISRVSSSRGQQGSWLVAICEGSNFGREVGIVAVNRETGRVIITQTADCQTYVKTLLHLSLHSPATILAPDTFFEKGVQRSSKRVIIEHIREEFPDVPVQPFARRYFNEEDGEAFVAQLALDNSERAGLLLTLHDKFYAKQATAAVFKYIEGSIGTVYANHSLHIKYEPIEGSMMIDTETARNLEIVCSISGQKNHSLFGLLNSTFTPQGARLLRTSLLSPLTSSSAVDARLGAVSTLIQSEETFQSVQNALKGVQNIDLDRLIVRLASVNKTRQSEVEVGVGIEAPKVKIAYERVGQLLDLQRIIRNLPTVADAAGNTRDKLLTIIAELVSDPQVSEIENAIDRQLNDATLTQKKGSVGALANVNSRVYAVKAQQNPLLDVARASYKENVHDIFEYAQEIQKRYNLPIELQYQRENGGGFSFILPRVETEDPDWSWPGDWVDRVSRKKKWIFSTLQLKKLNGRMRDTLEEALAISTTVLGELFESVLARISALYKASEAIALLDVLWSFAKRSIQGSYVRPEFTGTLAVKAGRHPILENMQGSMPVVPNDVFANRASCFQIIQGPVGTKVVHCYSLPANRRKSTYIRQVALLTIMACCGGFVPAEFFDSLLSRLSNEDDLERSLSTFSNEMVTCSMIIGLSTKDSLVLIDELGRGTSPQEGIGIAHAIAEELIGRKCVVFFTTHFTDLPSTLARYPSVVNLHLSVQNTRNNASGMRMLYDYKICDGSSTDDVHYGLELARLADLPSNVLTEAKKIAKLLKQKEFERKRTSASAQVAIRRKALLTLATQLRQILNISTLPDADLARYLLRLQTDVGAELEKTFLDE